MSSADHYEYRQSDCGWYPFVAYGEISGLGCVTTLPCETYVAKQPIGFRGAAPGESLDARGLPRIRVKAKGIPL